VGYSVAEKQTEPEQTSTPAPDCPSCADSGTVLLSLTGASGGLSKQVPCPDCEGGLKLTTAVPDAEALRREFQENYRNLALLVAAVACLAALGFLTRNGRPKLKDAMAVAVDEMEGSA
jgi:hypothetical protein